MCKSFVSGHAFVLFLLVSTFGAAEVIFTRKTDNGEIKYAFYEEGITWDQARQRCAAAGAQLLVAEDAAEARAVRARVDRHTGWAVWIGVSDLDRSGTYHTLDGRPVSEVYASWDAPAGQPDSVGGSLLCALMWTDALLYLTNCDWPNFYVCKFPAAATNRTTVSATHIVKEFFITLKINPKMMGQFKYHLHKEEVSWHQARERCELAGAQLVVPEDDIEAEAVVYEIHSVTQKWPIWIGISDLNTSGAYETLDGRPISAVHSKWFTGQPDSNGGKLRCVLLWYNYFLHLSNCDWLNFYVCKFLVPVNTIAIPTVPEEICGPCNRSEKTQELIRLSYEYSSETDIWMKLHRDPASWNDAHERCMKEGGHLASPISDNLLKEITRLMESNNTSFKIFTGINDIFTPGYFSSVEGISLEDIPAPWHKIQQCPEKLLNSIVLQATGELESVSRDGTYPYVCYQKSIDKIGTENDCKCYKRSNRTESYYKLHDVAKNWSEAITSCEGEGAHLIDLDKVAEADVLKELFPTSRADDAWIGLAEFGQLKKWMTVQGETSDYIKNTLWVPGKSHHSAEEALCGTILQSGLIDSSNCSLKKKFLCEKLGSEEQHHVQ